VTPERKAELDRIYARQVANATAPDEIERAWMRYLLALWEEDGDLQIFLELRERPRMNGAKLDRQLMSGEKTRREVFHRIRERCADRYAFSLNRYGIAEIDITSETYRAITHDLGIQVLRAFRDVDQNDNTAVCRAMAKTWNHFVRRLHAQYGLPTVQAMRAKLPGGSDAEDSVLDSGDFETQMTPEERAELEAEVD